MAYKTGAKGNSRDFGVSGPGKGSADRTTNRSAYVKHFSKIKFTGGVKFVKMGNKLIKKYS
jgi:hypothetical protein